MKHYKWAEFLSNFRMSSPPAQMSSPPIEDFVATVLVCGHAIRGHILMALC